MKKMVYLSVGIMVLVLCGCGQEEIAPSPIPSVQGTLTAYMPDNTPSTRVALTEGGVLGLDVMLTWEMNDVIELCFVQNGQKVKTTATVTSVLEEGKKAVFEYTIPGSIHPEQPYDLYGVYGGAGLDAENPSLAVMNAGSGTGRLTLDDVKTHRDVMLWFDKKGITGTTVNTAAFRHIGALISVTISNTFSTSLQFASMKYASAVGDNWVYNAGATPSKFDLTTGNLYPGTENSAAASLFKATTPIVTINPNQDFTFWQWIVPMGVEAKNPQLILIDANGNTIVSSNTLATREPEVGKRYNIEAYWNGTTLKTRVSKIVFKNYFWGDTGQIELSIDAAEYDRPNVWIDLNNNEIKDSGEAVTTFGIYNEAVYTQSSRTVTIYGRVTSLRCMNNRIISLNVSGNRTLQRLECYYNGISSLDITKNPALTYLDCSNNNLSALDPTKNRVLNWLRCNNNKITSLDVSKNSALVKLSCNANELTELNISANTQLDVLQCMNNKLQSLDVSNNHQLLGLYCSENQLPALDLSGNPELLSLECAKNQLTSLDFTHNTKLTGIHCYSNKILDNEMNSMILSMPALPHWHTGGRILLFDSQNGNEQNSHTTEQVELLNSKRWKVYDYNNANPVEIGSVTSPFQ